MVIAPRWPTVTAAADRVLLVVGSRPEPATLDLVLPPLDAVARCSKAWLGTAAVLAATGGSRGRRAAAHGLAALGLSSTVGHGLKRVVRRPRPPAHLWRRAAHRPTSPSMPSTRVAKAAAFATAMGLQWPATALPLAVAAAVVSWSRVYAGTHYPADVVVGGVLGCTAGVAVHVAAQRVSRTRPMPRRIIST